MDGVKLLAQARDLGFRVTLKGSTLVVRGPKDQEALARRLIQAKPEVVAALQEEAARRAFPTPATLCPQCNGLMFWRRHHGHWLCATCHPAPNPDVVRKTVVVALQQELMLPGEVMQALDAHGWEAVEGVEFPSDHEVERSTMGGTDGC